MCSASTAALLQQPNSTAHIWSNILGGAVQGGGGFISPPVDNRKIP